MASQKSIAGFNAILTPRLTISLSLEMPLNRIMWSAVYYRQKANIENKRLQFLTADKIEQLELHADSKQCWKP
jgi:hypothetical protein